jgi:hypothetical protein
MSGITALLNYTGNDFFDNVTKTDNKFMKILLGHQSEKSKIIINDIVLLCDGNIYNSKELFEYMNITPKTENSCEIIIHLYLKYGIGQTLQTIDGDFAFLLYDNRILDSYCNKCYVARDPFGVRPFYKTINGNKIGFTSFDKTLSIPTGTYSVYDLSYKVCANWEIVQENIPYFIPISNVFSSSYSLSIFDTILKLLQYSVEKRITHDISNIAVIIDDIYGFILLYLINNYIYNNNLSIIVKSYSISSNIYNIDLTNQTDLDYFIIQNHTIIPDNKSEIYAKYMNDTTIFTSDGIQYLFGINNIHDNIQFDKSMREILNRDFSQDVFLNLEYRLPILDKNFIYYIFSLSSSFRNENKIKIGKILFETTFKSWRRLQSLK